MKTIKEHWQSLTPLRRAFLVVAAIIVCPVLVTLCVGLAELLKMIQNVEF